MSDVSRKTRSVLGSLFLFDSIACNIGGFVGLSVCSLSTELDSKQQPPAVHDGTCL